MTQALLIFAAQFTYILALGFQTQNVMGRHYLAAMGNSFLLGMLGLTMTSAIAVSAVKGGDWWLAVAYLTAGPLGIATSMWLHPRVKGLWK